MFYYMDEMADELNFMQEKHEGQLRLVGAPYWEHPASVAIILLGKGFDRDHIVAGLFHDLLEDTDATEKEIYDLGSWDVLRAVKLVTKAPDFDKERDMEAYVAAINESEMAKMVKLADRLHNLRDAVNAPEDFQRRYLAESIKYYIPMAKDTVFEQDIQDAVDKLSKAVE